MPGWRYWCRSWRRHCGAAGLSGHIERVSDGRPLRSEEAAEAVVYFRPDAPVAPAPMHAEVMSTRRKRFEPRVLAITVGSTVAFPNRDAILHNVFSTARGNRFDIGLVAEGEGGHARFDQPGYVRVYWTARHRTGPPPRQGRRGSANPACRFGSRRTAHPPVGTGSGALATPYHGTRNLRR